MQEHRDHFYNFGVSVVVILEDNNVKYDPSDLESAMHEALIKQLPHDKNYSIIWKETTPEMVKAFLADWHQNLSKLHPHLSGKFEEAATRYDVAMALRESNSELEDIRQNMIISNN